MVRKTRKQKEQAAQRRKYLTRLAELAEIKEEIPQKEVFKKTKAHLEQKVEEVKIASPVEYIISDFKKALLLSGLFIAILIILAILEANYRFLGPLASRLMERLVR